MGVEASKSEDERTHAASKKRPGRKQTQEILERAWDWCRKAGRASADPTVLEDGLVEDASELGDALEQAFLELKAPDPQNADASADVSQASDAETMKARQEALRKLLAAGL